MKIAQVAPLYESVQARAHGGTERVVSHLTEALVAMGHDVTLFASGDSITQANLVAVVPCGLRLDGAKPDPLVWHAIMMDMVREYASQYDVIHFHTDVMQLSLVSQCQTPSLSTPHGRLDLPDLKPLFLRFGAHAMTSVSTCQRSPVPWVNWRKTIHHGLPSDLYDFNAQAQNYFALDTSTSSAAAQACAVEIAQSCGVALRTTDSLDLESKHDLVRNATLLLTPVDAPDPSGLAMIEASACGTPVLAWRGGAAAEIVEDGTTGFVVDNMERAVAAAKNASQLWRNRCREVFERRFSAPVMAAGYVDVYQQLVHERVGSRRPARNDAWTDAPVEGRWNTRTLTQAA